MKKVLSVILLCFMFSGCMFSLSRTRAVVLGGDDFCYGLIIGKSYEVINMEGKNETIIFKEQPYIVSAKSMIGAEERKNNLFFKGVKVATRNKATTGSMLLISGIILRVLALKRKSDKGEEIDPMDIIKIFKFKKRKKA